MIRSVLRADKKGSLNRRKFLKAGGVMTTAALSGLAEIRLLAGDSKTWLSKPVSLIDTNISLGEWPFRRLPLDRTARLVARLKDYQVTQAWAGTFEGLLHKNLQAANARLAEDCRQNGGGILLPFGSINPTLPAWKEDVMGCHERHRMPGIRLHPNYHGYKLDHPQFAELLDLASERGLIVQLVLSMEDERMQHPLGRVPDVDASPLLGLLESRPRLRLVLLNWFRAVKAPLLPQLESSGQVGLDVATIEGVGGIGKVLSQLSPRALVFGSHAPFYYFEGAWLKLKETVLQRELLDAICNGNARRLRLERGGRA